MKKLIIDIIFALYIDGEYSHLEDGGIVRSGYGIHTTSDGLVYKGIWENDKMNGKGRRRVRYYFW